MRTRAVRVWLALAVLTGGMAVEAGDDPPRPPVSGPETFDGRFVFARIRYADGYVGGGFAFRQDLPWAHDYPQAEANLMRILEAISFVNPYLGRDGGTILTLDDPNLFKYPFAYMSEPGYWTDRLRRRGARPAELPAEGRLPHLRRLPGRLALGEPGGADAAGGARAAVAAAGRHPPRVPLVLRHRHPRRVRAGVPRLRPAVLRHVREQRPGRAVDGGGQPQQRHRRVLGVLDDGLAIPSTSRTRRSSSA